MRTAERLRKLIAAAQTEKPMPIGMSMSITGPAYTALERALADCADEIAAVLENAIVIGSIYDNGDTEDLAMAVDALDRALARHLPPEES